MTRILYHHCQICHTDKPVAMEPDHGALFYVNEDDAWCCGELILETVETWRDQGVY